MAKKYSAPKKKSSKSNASLTVGTKAQVWHGTAKHTSGGVTRNGLMKTSDGRIVSKKAHAHGKRMFRKNETVMRLNQAPAFM